MRLFGGGEGIRTPGTLAGTPDFESGTFGLSVISPFARVYLLGCEKSITGLAKIHFTIAARYFRLIACKRRQLSAVSGEPPETEARMRGQTGDE